MNRTIVDVVEAHATAAKTVYDVLQAVLVAQGREVNSGTFQPVL